MYKPLRYIPTWAHVEVMRHREAYEAASFRKELDDRFGKDRNERLSDPRARRCGAWADIVARQPEVA